MTLLTQYSLPVAILSITVLSAGSAGAWDRHTSVTGPDGKTVSSHESANCHDDECRAKQVIVGPNGNTIVRTGKIKCHENECDGTVRVTGPEGKTVTRRIRAEQ